MPAIFLVNQTSIIRYHGPKDLLSLVQFYERNTGKSNYCMLVPNEFSETIVSPKLFPMDFLKSRLGSMVISFVVGSEVVSLSQSLHKAGVRLSSIAPSLAPSSCRD